MSQFQIKVQPRAETGRGPALRLRKLGKVPAVIYGILPVSGKEHTRELESRPVQVDAKEFREVYQKTIGILAVVDVLQDGQPTKLAIVKDVQKDPLKDTFTHVDLHEVLPNEKLVAQVPVHTKGDAYGVRNESAILEIQHHTVKVRGLPRSLPPSLLLDVTELRAGQAIHVRDLPKVEGIEYLDHADVVVVSCATPRAVEAEETAATPAAGAAAPAAGAAADAKAGDAKAAPAAAKPAAKK